jgi:integrase
VKGISPRDKSKIFLMASPRELAYRRSNTRTRQEKTGIASNPHLLRHSFAIWSLDGGVPVGDLQDQLGHASLATTGIYLKASPNHRREAYMRSKLSNLLEREKI